MTMHVCSCASLLLMRDLAEKACRIGPPDQRILVQTLLTNAWAWKTGHRPDWVRIRKRLGWDSNRLARAREQVARFGAR